MAYTIYSYHDIKQNKFTKTEQIIGRKALILSSLIQNKELQNSIPPFSILTSDFYYEFIKALSNRTQVDNNSELGNPTQAPSFVKEQLADYFPRLLKGLNLNGKYRLAIRPSIGCIKKPELRFSGLLPTFLNITNIDELSQAITEVFNHVQQETFLLYLKSNGLTFTDISISIIIQKMIIPEVSGIAYPYNPVTHNNNEITIEAVYGLGDTISKGEIVPDIYIVTTPALNIKEKRITPQTWMRVPAYGKVHKIEHTEKIELSQLMQYSQKLEDPEIIKLAKLVHTLNSDPENIWLLEWGASGGKIYIYQVKFLGKKSRPKKEKLISKERNGTEYIPPLLQGLPLSYGIGIGEVFIVNNKTSGKITYPTKNFILVTKALNPNHIANLKKTKCQGLILDTVVPNNEISLLLQDLKIPAIGATYYATKILKKGNIIKLDANTGNIYKITNPAKRENTSTIGNKKPKTSKNKRSNPTIGTHKPRIQLLPILAPKNKSVFTNVEHNWFLYDLGTIKTNQITSMIKKYPQARHLVINSLIKKVSLQKNLDKLNAGTIIPSFIITSFQDLILATKFQNKKIALLINIPALYTIFNGKHSNWDKDAGYITFLDQMLLRYRESSNIILGALLPTEEALAETQIKKLVGIGMSFIVQADTL